MTRRHGEGLRQAAGRMLSLCLSGLLAVACQTPAPLAPVACGTCEDQDHVIRLQAAPQPNGQPGFTHPFVLGTEDWKVILRSIHVRSHDPSFLFFTTKRAVEPAFTDDEVEYLSGTLSLVFGRARPDEQVVFALSRHPSANLMEVTSGGWSVNGSSIRLVLANYRYAITTRAVRELVFRDPLWSKSGPFYDLVPGDHQTVVEEEGPIPRLFSLALPVLSITYKPLLLGEVPAASATRNSEAGGALSPRPGNASPPRASLEEKLQTLKRLKDQGLITNEEYVAKKKQLLEGL